MVDALPVPLLADAFSVVHPLSEGIARQFAAAGTATLAGIADAARTAGPAGILDATRTVDAARVVPSVAPPALDSSGWLAGAVEEATGWLGLAVIFAYSFLIAFALPGVSEVVLAAPIDVGLPYWGRMSTIVAVSAVGKTAGSLFAFHIGQEAKESGPIIRALRRSRFDLVEWSEKRTIRIARKWGYAGLAMALCVPGFPDTLSIYAFAVLERDYAKFALATFVGSVGRLVLWLAGAEVVLFFA